MCVAAVLGDDDGRVSVLGGRDGVPRSLGSVYGGSVTRFLGGSLRGVVSRVINTPGIMSYCNGVTMSRDGSALLVCDNDGGSHAIHVFSVADGSKLRVVGGLGYGRLRFNRPYQVWIASDDFVFVADNGNDRVQVLTPSLDFHSFVGVGHLHSPGGVCASADVVVVSETDHHRISVLNRRDGALIRRIECALQHPQGVCFMSGDRLFAVAEESNDRVSVLSVDGEFIRHVGVGALRCPQGVTCSAFNELVVANVEHGRVVVFGEDGSVCKVLDGGDFSVVGMVGCTVAAVDLFAEVCFLYE
jgi:DNA-binding beta-propeller fold protein YncE